MIRSDSPLAGMGKIIIVPYPCSWGSVQLSAESSYPPFKKYEAWVGDTRLPVTLDTIVDGLKELEKQITKDAQ